MDSRERYQRALTFQGPDRAPIMHHQTAGAFRVHGKRLEALYAKYPSDVLLSPKTRGMFAFWDRPRGTGEVGVVTRDDWGCGWLWLTSDYMGQAVEHPLARWEALDGFRPPEPMTGVEGVRYMEQTVRQDGRRRFVLIDGGEVWQRMFFLRGFEALLVDLLEDRPEVYALRDMVVDWDIARIQRWLETKLVDAVLIRDDWGTQEALMVRPAIWRKVFKPAYKRIVDAIHAGGANACFHTDGFTMEIIPDLIEVGFDELNPQVHLMDVEELGRRFGGKVCFRPDIDRQRLLPRGTPEEIRAYVRRLFDAFGRSNGGFVGWGEANADVSLANTEAMLDAFFSLR
ncbi:MAG: uroporphyrinogen decarboxylase family protein [Chloroflexota bacterium]|nr:uroporphyrinogen decarboxylase family protein [Chloroflexota bacterium]